MRHCIFPTLAALVMLLAACEKQIDIDVDARQPEVVVRALGETGEPLAVRLTYSRPVFGTFYVPNGEGYFKEIADATVSLSVDGSPHSGVNVDGGNYTFAYQPQAGDHLVLSVAVPGHKTVTAEAVVPHKPAVSGIGVSHNTDQDRGIRNNTIAFTLADPASSTDYYSVRLRCHETSIYTKYDADSNIVWTDTTRNEYYCDFKCTDYTVISSTGIDVIDPEDPDAANTYVGDEMLFSDANINGNQHQFKLEPYGYYEYEDYDNYYGYDTIERYMNSRDYYLEVSAISRDTYMYLQSVDAYDYDEVLSLFSEPVQIHSNVSGGIGIFGIRTKVSFKLQLND